MSVTTWGILPRIDTGRREQSILQMALWKLQPKVNSWQYYRLFLEQAYSTFCCSHCLEEYMIVTNEVLGPNQSIEESPIL